MLPPDNLSCGIKFIPFSTTTESDQVDMIVQSSGRIFSMRCILRLSQPLRSSLVWSSCPIHFTARRGHRGVAEPSPSSFAPVGTTDDIRERCKPVFCLPDCRDVIWTGVFGSFSRNKQNPEIDVDLLVGIKEGASEQDFWYLPASVKEKLEEALQRDVDMLYLENGYPLSFIQAQALVTGRTVYDTDIQWLLAQQTWAEAVLLDAHGRFREALQTVHEGTFMITLIPAVQGMIRALHSEDENAEGINNYVGCYSWETAITELFMQYRASSGVLAEDDVERLWGLLAEDIPRE
jgi:predicted nucleotidyltransferase